MDLLTPTVGFFTVLGLIVYFESKRREPCPHLRTRCLHGDEITHRMKVYVLRAWKPEEVRRQLCLACGIALDRTAICTATGEELHEWEGPWPYDEGGVAG